MRVSSWIIVAILALSASSAGADATFQLSSFREHQKRAYENGHWESFFGAAQAYRRRWWKEAGDPELVTLEILGLIRFCRYEEALILNSGLRAWAEESEARAKLVPVLNRLEALIPGAEALKIAIARKAPPADEGKVITRWPIPPDSGVRLPPTHFRARVEDRCGA